MEECSGIIQYVAQGLRDRGRTELEVALTLQKHWNELCPDAPDITCLVIVYRKIYKTVKMWIENYPETLSTDAVLMLRTASEIILQEQEAGLPLRLQLGCERD